MSHRHSRWFREAVESRPLWKLQCQRCGETMLTYDPELSKVAHQGTKHFGVPWDFSCRKQPESAEAPK